MNPRKKFVYIPSFRVKKNGAWRWLHGKRGYFRVLRIPANFYVEGKYYTPSNRGVEEVYATRDVDNGTKAGRWGVYDFEQKIADLAKEYNESVGNQISE